MDFYKRKTLAFKKIDSYLRAVLTEKVKQMRLTEIEYVLELEFGFGKDIILKRFESFNSANNDVLILKDGYIQRRSIE